MRILSRYILGEILSHAVIGVAVFTFVIFMQRVTFLLELVVRNSAPLPSVAEIFFLTLPQALVFTIPMGVLVGVLIGLSRLAADSEITAMRASGFGVLFFLRPVTLFAVGAWLIAACNSIYIAPRSAIALAHLQESLKTSQASFEIQPRVFYENLKDNVLYVQDVTASTKAATWRNIFMADVSSPGAPKITLARRGIVVNEGSETFHLHLSEGSQQQVDPAKPDDYTISSFGETDIAIPLVNAAPPSARDSGPVSEIYSTELLQVAKTSEPLRARGLWIEFHRRLALPTSCLVLMLVGVPLGLSSRKGGKSTGFVLTMILVFLYYFTLSAGVALAKQGRVLPGAGVWMANIVFSITGLFLCWKADRGNIEVFSVQQLWLSLKEGVFKAIGRANVKIHSKGNGSNGDATGTFEWGERRLRKRNYNNRYPLILDDYVLREFLTYFALMLATFVLLMLIFTLFELLSDILRNKIGLLTIGKYLVNLIPQMFYFMTPLSVLLSVLVTFGLMEKSNELTAMKATGTSLYRIVVPVLVLSGFLAIGLFEFDQLYLPQANKRQEELRNTIKGKPAQTFLRPDRKWIVGEQSPQNRQEPVRIYSYAFFDPDRNQFGDLSIFEFDRTTFQLQRRIFAERAYWEDSMQKWVLQQGWQRSFRGEAIETHNLFDVTTFPEFQEQPTYFKKEVRQSSEMNFDELRRYIRDLQQSGFDVMRLRVQLYKKLAFPVMTLVMAVLAVPFAVSAGKRGALTGVAIAVLLAVVYWMTSGLFEALGNVNYLPAVLAAWFPDVIFALLGGYLLLRVST